MHSRRIACFLLGGWFAGGVFMALLAIGNMHTGDRLTDPVHPALMLQFKSAGIPALRGLFRYAAAEQTRFYRENWEIAQILLGAFFFFFLLFGTREDKYSLLLALLLLLAVIAQRFLLTPEIIGRGRMLDFVPPNVDATERMKLLLLERVYNLGELVKLGLGMALAARLMSVGRRRSDQEIRQELDLIDKANYRHVNG
jgi:hypothetical protein